MLRRAHSYEPPPKISLVALEPVPADEPECRLSVRSETLGGNHGNGRGAPLAAIVRIDNNEEHRIIPETPVSERCAISSRAPGLRLGGLVRRVVCPNSSVHVRSGQ